MPLHKGHLLVCDVGRFRVDQFTVLCCSHDAEPIDGFLRANWVRESLDGTDCNVVHMHRDIPQEPKDHPHFWSIWKDAIFEHHPEPLDFVFGSETYVYQLAQLLDAKPFVVDLDRKVIPISGTKIREQPGKNWAYLPRLVRGHFRKRFTLIGPESTGKSMLSEFLAQEFYTVFIPEYGRDFDAIFRQGENWLRDDFMEIARGQQAIRKAIIDRAGPIVFEDTDILQTIVWSEALLGEAPAELVRYFHQTEAADHYFLLSPETTWIDDGTRYHSVQEERNWFSTRLKYWLKQFDVPWTEIGGETWAVRRKKAIEAVKHISTQTQNSDMPLAT